MRDLKEVQSLAIIQSTGKSTIAQTFAERSSAYDRLGASFFCSRDFDDRSNIYLIFPTLAFHLACRYAEFKSSLIQILNSTPNASNESLALQPLCAVVTVEGGIRSESVFQASRL